MRLEVFVAAAFAATVEGARLKAFPSEDLLEREQLEFAQTYDEEAFLERMDNLAQYENLPVLSDDLFMQSLTVAEADVYTHLMADVVARGRAFADTEISIEGADGWYDITHGLETGLKGTIGVVDTLFDQTVTEFDAGIAIISGNFSEGGEILVKGGKKNAKKLHKSTDQIGTGAFMTVAGALQLGDEAFVKTLEAAKKAGDVITVGVGKLVGMVSKKAAIINKIIHTDFKNMKPRDVVNLLKELPVVGDIVSIGDSVYKIGDRIVNGEKDLCYRTGMQLRGYKKGECEKVENMANPDCLNTCPVGKKPVGFVCLNNCPKKFPVGCGVMCTASKELCPSLFEQTVDLVNAGVTVAKTAGDVASMNVVGFLEKGLGLIEHFAHPLCSFYD